MTVADGGYGSAGPLTRGDTVDNHRLSTGQVKPTRQPPPPAPPPVRQSTLAQETLVGRAQDGDIASFEALVRLHQGPVFRLAYRMMADRGDAEDVVQDTFVLVWRQLPTLHDPATFRGWVYSIATRRCLNLLRTRRRRQTSTVPAASLQAAHDRAQADQPATGTGAGTSIDPALAAQHTAQREDLQVLLQALPEEQRACWLLREIHELSYAEIASATRLPVSTVRGRIARARQNLAKGMAPWR